MTKGTKTFLVVQSADCRAVLQLNSVELDPEVLLSSRSSIVSTIFGGSV